jgi:hypothetical protein
MAEVVDVLQGKIGPLIASAKAARADGTVTLSEAWSLLVQSTQILVDLVEAAGDGWSGPEKKAVVLVVLSWSFDQLWPVTTSFGWFAFLRVLPAATVKSFLFAVLDAPLERFVAVLPG